MYKENASSEEKIGSFIQQLLQGKKERRQKAVKCTLFPASSASRDSLSVCESSLSIVSLCSTVCRRPPVEKQTPAAVQVRRFESDMFISGREPASQFVGSTSREGKVKTERLSSKFKE